MLSTLFVLATAAAPPAPPTKTLLQYIQGGGFIGYLIIMLSIVALAFAIVMLITVRRERLSPESVREGLARHFASHDIPGAIRYCADEANDCFLTRVIGGALTRCSRSPFGLLELRSALEESGQREVERLGRPNDAIALIASVAPMLGLLGTVVGMVGAFDTISATQGSARPAQLAGYISIALITTVQGLVVAIPCTAAYAYFRSRIDRLAGEIGETIESYAGELDAGAHGPGAKGAARPAPRPAGAPGIPGAPAGSPGATSSSVAPPAAVSTQRPA